MRMDDFENRIAAMRGRLDDCDTDISGDTDPRALHDEVRQLVEDMRAHHAHVPADLREAVEELEAEILEDFYDNLPV